MTPELRVILGLALIAGALTGLALALLERAEPPRPYRIAVIAADPAAYEIAALLEEARRIAREAAAGDA